MGRGSVCDPFDAAAIVERIATGETTAADAYRRYAASAARALRPRDVRPKAEPRKNESRAVGPGPRRGATP
jgi:hypothetical protein